jgi:hypothetical protein
MNTDPKVYFVVRQVVKDAANIFHRTLTINIHPSILGYQEVEVRKYATNK